MVSLNSEEKARFFFDVLERASVNGRRVPFFWTGGFFNMPLMVSWPNGRKVPVTRGTGLWSLRGVRGAQPDGTGLSEQCVAVLDIKHYMTVLTFTIFPATIER